MLSFFKGAFIATKRNAYISQEKLQQQYDHAIIIAIKEK